MAATPKKKAPATPKKKALKVVEPEEQHGQSKVSLDEMSETVLWCRLTHDWVWKGDKVTTKRGFVIEFVRRQECQRCTAFKEQTISVPSFTVLKTRSNYPPGYLSNEGRLHRSDILREQFGRMGYKFRALKEAD